MKANELRIGNWVKYSGDLITVFSIDNNSINGSFYGDTSAIYLEGLEFIPLTPEILEKVNWRGYIKFNINSYFSIDDVGHLYYHNDYTGINMNHLHQLQNLYFALTGNELEINLNP